MSSISVPLCVRAEPLQQQPVFERRDVHPRAGSILVPLSTAVPGRDLRDRYATTATTTQRHNNLPATAGKTPKMCVAVLLQLCWSADTRMAAVCSTAKTCQGEPECSVAAQMDTNCRVTAANASRQVKMLLHKALSSSAD